MSFLKYSNSEANWTLYPSNFAFKEIKGRTIISDEQNLENSFLNGFYASENQN